MLAVPSLKPRKPRAISSANAMLFTASGTVRELILSIVRLHARDEINELLGERRVSARQKWKALTANPATQ